MRLTARNGIGDGRPGNSHSGDYRSESMGYKSDYGTMAVICILWL